MKLMLAYCHGGMIHADFADSLVGFLLTDGQGRQLLRSVQNVSGLYVAQNRNRLVEKFLADADCTHLMFLDSDIVFTPEDVYRLADAASQERPIVAGLYVSRFEDDRLRPVWHQLVTTDKPEGQFVELRACGMGFTLIAREVLEKMRAHFALDPYHWFAHDVAVLKEGRARMGEDAAFCARARVQGFRVFGHYGVRLGHMKVRRETPDIWDEELAALEARATRAA